MLSLPEEHTIHLWRTEFPVAKSMSLDEQKDNWRSLTQRWIQGTLMSQYGLSEAESEIDYHESGQPYLKHLNDKIYISISHSFELSSFALSPIPKLGIDLEKQLPSKNLSMLWSQLKLNKESLSAERFYTIWTQLEAFTKAQGSSIWQTQWAAEKLLGFEDTGEQIIHGTLNEESWYFYTDGSEKAIVSVAQNSDHPIKVDCFSTEPNLN